MLVISNRPRASRSSDFEITRAITPRIVLHSVQLLLLSHTRDQQIGLPLRGRPIFLSLVLLQTELDST